MKKWDKEEIEKIIRLAEGGKNCSEIAKEIGRTKKSVQLKFIRIGVSLKKESKVYKNCKHCNNIFESLQGEKRIFCSKSCAASFNNKLKKIDYSKTKKAYCKRCGKEIIVNKMASLKNVVCEDCKLLNRKVNYCDKNGRDYDIKKQKDCQEKVARYCKVCKKNEVLKFKTICEPCKTKYYKFYRVECEFKFSLSEFSSEVDIELIKKTGMYSPTNKKNNLNGASRDHIFSVKNGFLLGINPIIIRHPANCQIISQLENQSKYTKSNISLKKLLQKIKLFEKKHQTNEFENVLKEVMRLKKIFK